MKTEVDRELARRHAEKLGDLHADLCDLLYGQGFGVGDDSMRRSELYRLCRLYGDDNVRWMLGVIAEDSHMETEM